MYNQVEALERAQLRQLQDERLRSMVAYVTQNVPFYQNLFQQSGLLSQAGALPRSEGGKLKRALDLRQL